MGNAEHLPQQRVWTRNAFVIFASLLLFFNTISLLPYGIDQFRSFFYGDNDHSFSRGSSRIASLENLDLAQLQGGGDDVAIVLQAAADLLGAVSTQNALVSLQALSKELHRLAADTNKAQGGGNLRSRGFFDAFTGGATGGKGGGGGGIAGIFSSLEDKTLDSLAGAAQYLGDGVGRGATTGLDINNGVKQTTAEKPTGFNKVAGNLGFGVSNGLTGSLNTSSLASGAGAASSSLGAGLGGGAASGLGLNKSAVVAPGGGGIAGIAGGLGNGLTNSFLSNVDMSKLMSGLPSGMLKSAIVNAGKGLGEGAAEGLQLPLNAATATRLKRAAAAAAAAEPNAAGSGMDASKAAYGFTRSLSSSFLGAVDVKKLASQAMSGSSVSSMVGPAIVGAGSGLGAGAAQGLGLSSKAVDPTTASDAGAPEIAQNFAYQLTTGFLANGSFASLQSKIMSAMSMTDISSMLGPAALGAGSGIGQGAAVGLGLQDPPVAQSSMAGDIATVVKGFSFSLTSSFLANGTVSRLQSKAASSFGGGSNSSAGGMMSALQGVSFSKAAEGLARGLVDGAGQSVSSMGGFQAILTGDSSSKVMMQAATPVFKTNDFNDTTGGVATSFGQGLGGQGVTLIAQTLGMMMFMAANGTSKPTPSGNGTSTPAMSGNGTAVFSSSFVVAPNYNSSTTNLRSRSIFRRMPLPSPSPSLPNPKLDKRVDSPFNITELTSDLINGVNVTSIDVIAQRGVDTLTCEGIGGLVQVFNGLMASGSVPSMLGGSSLPLPNATFTVESQDNEFKVNPAALSITVNGVSIIRLVILIVAHVFLVILAYFIAIPFALLLSSGNEIATMLGRPHIWAQASKYRFYIWCFGVMPLSLGGLGLGVSLLGTASHGKSFHGILGFATVGLTFIAFVLEMKFNAGIKALRLLRGVVLSTVFGAASAAFVTGFMDIQRISLCTVRLPDAVLIGAAMAVSNSLTTGVTVVMVKMYIQKWMGRAVKGVPGMGDGRDLGGRVGGGEEVEKSGFEDDDGKKTFIERVKDFRG